MHDVGQEKAEWRDRAREARRSLTPDHEAIGRHLAGFLDRAVPRPARIVVYDALPDEVDLGPLIEACPDPTDRFAVTRTPDDGFDLTIHPFGGPVERHRYGYTQPRPDAPVVPDADIGAVLVPGLAFALDGGRLGRGKGYYDRFLARLGDRAVLIGMTGGYVVDRVPTDVHDVAMTHLCLEDEVVPIEP